MFPCKISPKECDGCGACEPEPMTECYICGKEIRIGDQFYHISGEDYCTECVRDALRTYERNV